MLPPLVFYHCGFNVNWIQFQAVDVKNLNINLDAHELRLKELLDFPLREDTF